MLVFQKIIDIKAYLLAIRKEGKSIGFVPTMGALHSGHLSLVEESKKESDFTVCSIFVNPSQFNKKNDLDNYPRNIDADIKQLESVDCDVLFLPSVEEMYPKEIEKMFDFGDITKGMEGEHRPGHFNGVAIVIERFFEIIQPNFAFFGEKDFQQLMVVKELVKQLNLSVEIIGCATSREISGLAMSSRNERLTEKEKEVAGAISQSLIFMKEHFKSYSVGELKQNMISQLSKHKELEVEYFEIVDGNTMKFISDWSETSCCVALTAVNVGEVRLIDNMLIYEK